MTLARRNFHDSRSGSLTALAPRAPGPADAMMRLLLSLLAVFVLTGPTQLTAQEGGEPPAAAAQQEPGFFDKGGAIDQWFGSALEVVAYVPFYNLLGGPDAAPEVDADGSTILGPTGSPVVRQLPLVVLWLVIGAVFFTLSWRFANLRLFRHAIEVVRGRFDNPNDHGEVTHFQALASALSATVGLGNIAGVAIAVGTGGPGATF